MRDLVKQALAVSQANDMIRFWLLRLRNHDYSSYTNAIYGTCLAKHFFDHCDHDIKDQEVWLRSYLLKDIGKLWIPSDHLVSSTYDSRSFYEYGQHHPMYSVQLLNQFQCLHLVSKDAVLFHHEYLDGTGFPNGKRWNSLTIETRLITLFDTFVQHTQHGFNEQSLEDALEELFLWSDVLYDGALVKLFANYVQSFSSVLITEWKKQSIEI